MSPEIYPESRRLLSTSGWGGDDIRPLKAEIDSRPRTYIIQTRSSTLDILLTTAPPHPPTDDADN